VAQQQITGYQGRSVWYVKFFGVPIDIHKALMEDGKTALGIMKYAPVRNERLIRSHWVYATNGMSERRMPCHERPHGDPKFRVELIAYSESESPWIVELLCAMAQYPFVHRSGFSANQTIPVTDPNPHLWDGYLLLTPPVEPDDINPLAVDIGIGDDWVFHLQVVGLKRQELAFAIQDGGEAFAERYLPGPGGSDELRRFLCLDRRRASLL